MRSTLSHIDKTLSGLTEVKGALATLALRPLTSASTGELSFCRESSSTNGNF